MDNPVALASILSSSSPTHTPKEEYIIGQFEEQREVVGNHTEQPQSLNDTVKLLNEPTPGPENTGTTDGSSWEEQLYIQQEQLEKEMQETRKMVTRLQALLLHGSLPEDEQTASLFGDSAISTEQQLILIRSRLDQSMEESLDLKRELLRYKQEARNLQAVKVSSCENNGYSHKMEAISSPFQHGVGDELQLVRDALRSLRNSFSGHDPLHHTLDTLEQGVSSLIDHFHSTDSKKRQERKASMKLSS
ncbi:dixin-A [Silurus asotus]|uniref:Dixin-A n=1 Tax=Silurus asotus TaxID=30991 RepID=A0AAD5AQZ1_SILAS|nr:dixin-A [Silurus asotus]